MAVAREQTFKRFHGFAFSLLELVVVVVIVAVLLGMSIPAMQSMREMSRRSNCQQNLMQLSLALSSYSVQYGHYPAGTFNPTAPIANEPTGYHHNWISGLLPFLGGSELYEGIDFESGVYAPANQTIRNVRIARLLCPSAAYVRENSSCYAAVHASTESPIDGSNDGVFILNRGLAEADIPDGVGFTLFLAEKLSRPEEDLGWMSGTRSTLRNTGHPINAGRSRVHAKAEAVEPLASSYVGGILSDHPGGASLLLGSGETQFRSPSIDPLVLQQLAARADLPTPRHDKRDLDRQPQDQQASPAVTDPTSAVPQ